MTVAVMLMLRMSVAVRATLVLQLMHFEDWETVLTRFKDKFGYNEIDVSDLRRELDSIIDNEEQRLP